jgi:hypothetical protein
MKKLQIVLDPPTADAEEMKRRMGHLDPNADWEHEAWRINNSEFFLNDQYQVQVEPQDPGNPVVHLSIKRLDGGNVIPWRDKQAIKNQLLGPECEAIELYPADSRLVDTANQFHLWGVRDPDYRFPIGWNERKVIDGNGKRDPNTGVTQTPLDER